MVDASTKDRLGAGQALLAGAKEVHVFDHHAMKQPDIDATRLHLEGAGCGMGEEGRSVPNKTSLGVFKNLNQPLLTPTPP